MKNRAWLVYTVAVVVLWGVWGAFSALPAQMYKYPDEMIYVIWAFTMIIPCCVALKRERFDPKLVGAAYGLAIGLTGAGGQLVLFAALVNGPAYLIFPIVSLSPVITVLMAFALIHEKTNITSTAGVVLALVAILLFSVTGSSSNTPTHGPWLVLSVIVCVCWGVQAFLMKRASLAGVNDTTTFTWMTISGLLLVPIALFMMHTNPFAYPWRAPLLTAGTQVLNAIGALCLVMAFSRGKAIIVSPSTNALAPVVTVILSLAFYQTLPTLYGIVGIILALAGSTMMVYSDERRAYPPS